MAFYVVRRRRLVLAGIVASVALLIAGAAFVQLRAADSWATMQRTVRKLRTTWEQREHRREPLWGEATDENALVHYERANAAARQLVRAHNDALLKLLPQVHGDGFVATAAGDLRTAWQAVLPHLRAGAHATHVRPTTSPDADIKQQMTTLLDVRWVANAAILEARALRHEGRAIDAVHWSLDAATYAADLMRGSVVVNQIIGAAILGIATNEAWRDDAALKSLSRAALEELAAGLERLDTSLPQSFDLTAELLLCARSLQEVTGSEEWLPSAWRYGFSTRWMIADGFAAYAALADQFAEARTAAWPQRNAMWDSATNGALGSGNPIAAIVLPNMASCEHSMRLSVTRLRMLRIAIDLHRGDAPPSLDDPLGDGPLRVASEAGRVRITSAGSTSQGRVERVVAR